LATFTAQNKLRNSLSAVCTDLLLIVLFSRVRIYSLKHTRLLAFELLIPLRIFFIKFNGEL